MYPVTPKVSWLIIAFSSLNHNYSVELAVKLGAHGSFTTKELVSSEAKGSNWLLF